MGVRGGIYGGMGAWGLGAGGSGSAAARQLAAETAGQLAFTYTNLHAFLHYNRHTSIIILILLWNKSSTWKRKWITIIAPGSRSSRMIITHHTGKNLESLASLLSLLNLSLSTLGIFKRKCKIIQLIDHLSSLIYHHHFLPLTLRWILRFISLQGKYTCSGPCMHLSMGSKQTCWTLSKARGSASTGCQSTPIPLYNSAYIWGGYL